MGWQESSNRALLEFQEFVRVAERREKRKELEMREKEKERKEEKGRRTWRKKGEQLKK